MNHDDLIERLETAEVREPKKPSGQYVTTLGNQAAAALRELVAELADLEQRALQAVTSVIDERDAAQAERDALKVENERLNAYIQAMVEKAADQRRLTMANKQLTKMCDQYLAELAAERQRSRLPDHMVGWLRNMRQEIIAEGHAGWVNAIGDILAAVEGKE